MAMPCTLKFAPGRRQAEKTAGVFAAGASNKSHPLAVLDYLVDVHPQVRTTALSVTSMTATDPSPEMRSLPSKSNHVVRHHERQLLDWSASHQFDIAPHHGLVVHGHSEYQDTPTDRKAGEVN